MNVVVHGGDLPGIKALMKALQDADRGVLVGVPAGTLEGGAHERTAKAQERFERTRTRVASLGLRRQARRRAMSEFRESTLGTEEEYRSGPLATAMRRRGSAAAKAVGTAHLTFKSAKPIPLAMIAAVHEFGYPEGKIPERSFLRGGIRAARTKLARLNHTNLRAILAGKMTVTEALERLGVVAAGEVKRAITTLTFAPLKPATIARKGSSRPLVDTGQLRQSITYQLEPAGANARVIR